MRHIAALIIGAIALTCSNSTAMAQNSINDGVGQQESVTFVLELDDDMIATLKNGEDLKSMIPNHLRNKVTEVHLRYVGGNRTADRTHNAGTSIPGQSVPQQPVSSSAPFRSQTNPNDRGYQSSQGSNSRIDSNRRNNSADGLIDRSRQDSSLLPPRRQQQVPRFNPSGSSTGDQTNNSRDRMVPATPRSANNSTYPLRDRDQQSGVYGPPSPYSAPTGFRNPNASTDNNSYSAQDRTQGRTLNQTQDRRQPAVNPGGFQPRQSQPASTQGQRQDSYRNQPTDTRIQPRNPSGSEFDTVQNRRDGQGYTQPERWDLRPRQSQGQAGGGFRQDDPSGVANHDYRDGYQNRYQNNPANTPYVNPPQDRLASNQWNNGVRSDGQGDFRDSNQTWQPPQQTYQPSRQPRSSLVAGHDVPMIRNQVPRTASRPGYESYNSNSTLPTASIPGDSRPAGGEVKVNDGPNGVKSSSPVSQLNQFNNFLYFLLLCSIGLNIYLAWISRGFYVRYRELADELRDTFSTV